MDEPNESFFGSGAHNIVIQGGQFVQQTNRYDADDGFKLLQAHVATNAWTIQQAYDAPKCHPNTRIAVLDDIMSWVILVTTRIQWIMWLYGAAGAGKSAIARSVVDLCLQQNVVVARFFFFRSDPTRNSLQSLVATLAYQLIQQIPGLEAIISPRIQSHPLVFSESLETQFQVLIFEPLRQLYLQSSFQQVILLLLDGVDECYGHEEQADLISVIVRLVETKAIPLIVLFSSRPEAQIKVEFRPPKVSKITHQLPLDDHYLPDIDIQHFLDDSFAKTKDIHPFSRLLEPDWPSPQSVQEIVNKSSGQFIYASVVMKFISTPRFHPAHQLEIIRGLRPRGNLTPFAQLDALYRHIFSQLEDVDSTTPILAFCILAGTYDIGHCAAVLDMAASDIHIALADLTSVIICDQGRIHFLHASLPDFLLDGSRSQQYHIDRRRWSTKLAITFLRKPVKSRQVQVNGSILMLLPHANCTPDLRESILAFLPDQLLNYYPGIWIEYISTIQNLNFGDNGEVYRRQLNSVTRYIRKEHPDKLDGLRQKHNISDILAQIERKEAPEQDIARRRHLAGTGREGQQESTKSSSGLKSKIFHFFKR